LDTTIFKSVPSLGKLTSPVELQMSDVAAKIFEESLNKVVLVQLKGGRSVRGRLYSFDQHMNLVLEEAEDVTNSDSTKKLGTIIVRGDNVVLVSPPPKR
jgi:small nuclear ribonucleoprotein